MTSDAIDPAIVQKVVSRLRTNPQTDHKAFVEDVLDRLIEVRIKDELETSLYLAAVEKAFENTHPQRPVRRLPVARDATGSPRRDRPPAVPRQLEVEPSAPYRFVTLNNQVAKAGQRIVDHGLDRPLPDGFCGSITVDWAVETPMLIGTGPADGGEEGPLKLGDDFVIPGATLRGLLRASCEIVGYGRLFQVNRHHRYAVRDFNHELFRDDARPSWDTLRAGWLRRVADYAEARRRGESGYTITPCRKNTIRIRDLPPSFREKDESDGEFHKRWLGTELTDRYVMSGQKDRRGDKVDFSRPTRWFTRAPDGEDRLVPATADAVDAIQGVFVFAGRFPTASAISAGELDAQAARHEPGLHKKHEYVFEDDPAASVVSLSATAFARFELAHTKPSKNKREPDGSYARLFPTLEAGDRIPVFLIGDLRDPGCQEDRDFAIGLTRLFKRPHRNSVGDVLFAHHPAHDPAHGAPFQPDMVEALFGYVFEKDELGMEPGRTAAPRDLARKGRVAFGFATAMTPCAPAAEAVHPVLMTPRASFGPFYLRGVRRDWTDGGAKLAGRKRYFPRFTDPGSAKEQVYQTLGTRNDHAATRSHLRFLESRAADGEILFRGEIRLHNVGAAEIGLLLWALTHGGDPAKPYRHMIGRGKPAGAGQTRVRHLALNLTGNAAKADQLLAAPEPWERAGGASEGWTRGGQGMAPFLRSFEDAMRNVDGRWPETAPVLEFLGAAHPGLCGPMTRPGTAYLPLGDFRKVREGEAASRPGPGAEDRLLPAPRVAVEAVRRRGYRPG